jgi:beta-galactosidase/beta-glucuronidase
MRDMGLNTVRLEGKMEDDYFYANADNQGVLVMVG